MNLLKENGYQQFKVPQGKFADLLLQKKIYIDFLDENLYINAYVYDPDEIHPVRTVEFSFQRDESEGSIKIKLFSYKESDISSQKLEDIEEKAINLYTYSGYA